MVNNRIQMHLQNKMPLSVFSHTRAFADHSGTAVYRHNFETDKYRHTMQSTRLHSKMKGLSDFTNFLCTRKKAQSS